METIYAAEDAEGDRLDILAGPDSVILRRNYDEGQTVELTSDQVLALIGALTRWTGAGH